MGFSIGSLVEKVCDKLGVDEDWGDALGFAADAGLVVGGAYLLTPAVVAGTAMGTAGVESVAQKKASFGGTLKSMVAGAFTQSSLAGTLEHADDLVEGWGEDPLTASAWKDRIRADGYASFEAAVRNGEVADDVMKDAGMQSLRAEQEESQASTRDGLAALASIEASRTAALRG